MPAPDMVGIDGVRAGDLRIFVAAQRTGSVKGASRELSIAASHVSKTIAKLEARLGCKLFSRGARGMTLTEDGRRLSPAIEELLARFDQLERPRASGELEITVAAESYLISAFLPALVGCHRDLRVRGIEMATPVVRAHAAEGVFQIALLTGEGRLPAQWQEDVIGEVRRALFATPRVAAKLGAGPVSPEKLRAIPFVFPVFRAGTDFVLVDDGCPLPLRARRLGHQAPTMQVALELAARSDQLLYGPVLAARAHVSSGALVEVRVRGWDVRQPLVVAYDTARLLARVRTSIVTALTEAANDRAVQDRHKSGAGA